MLVLECCQNIGLDQDPLKSQHVMFRWTLLELVQYHVQEKRGAAPTNLRSLNCAAGNDPVCAFACNLWTTCSVFSCSSISGSLFEPLEEIGICLFVAFLQGEHEGHLAGLYM